ncbi:hypothetical protein SNEBB_010495 [Seison nebaliae]|nr:hypothetical protein SNEBB_010495 [Seison nebaliae]
MMKIEWKRLLHFGPLLALFVIGIVTFGTINISLHLFAPKYSLINFVNLAVFVTWPTLILYHFFYSIFMGPGYVPPNWSPNKMEEVEYVQYCRKCKSYKAPRSHHCRKCKKCVMKMDHHCPWINNCVGYRNQSSFFFFTLFCPVGCFHATLILTYGLYCALFHYIYMTINMFLISIFSLTFALAVTIAVSVLFYFQLKTLLTNETGIEQYIRMKAEERERTDDYENPYDLQSKLLNIREVIDYNDGGDCGTRGNGLFYATRFGYDNYSMSREQIAQKVDKKERSVEYKIIYNYSGSWLPITAGCGALFCIPFSDEYRLPVKKNETILVSRWLKYWLYGYIVIDSNGKHINGSIRRKGWIPRSVIYETIRIEDMINMKQD